MFGPLSLLVYIDDLTQGISANIKLFADDSSLFIKVVNVQLAQQILTDDLNKISSWANQWKRKFNPDITKQAVEKVVSSKYNKPCHPPLTFGNGLLGSVQLSIWESFLMKNWTLENTFLNQLRKPKKVCL